jgi:hypothetical protein
MEWMTGLRNCGVYVGIVREFTFVFLMSLDVMVVVVVMS